LQITHHRVAGQRRANHLHFAQFVLDRPIGGLCQIAAEILPVQDLNVLADTGRRAYFWNKLAVDVIDLDLARRRLALALLGLIRRERARDERHHRAGIARRALLDAEHHVVADIRHDTRWFCEGGLPDLQRVLDARAWRACRVGFEQCLAVCRHLSDLLMRWHDC